MLKNLRIKTFYPEKEYIHLTYAIKNDKERSKELIHSYMKLQKLGHKAPPLRTGMNVLKI
ncbi:hypothetical protein SJAV_01800 [Sulfurisphaera javensis]|uniref:Transposase n=1 Tax=Sulfurisphaera javensis TaxID=2049879 RepID=A0AAT9GN03_9CREN